MEVHTAPKWQRGKIARTLANKIAIAARVDYYRGSEDPSLKAGLLSRIERIKEKYKEPPKRLAREERAAMPYGRRQQQRRGGSRRHPTRRRRDKRQDYLQR
jgi:nucleolar protein 56